MAALSSLVISGSVSKAYVDLVSIFISPLKNFVLVGDDYLCHAPPILEAFRVGSLHAVPIFGGNLFDRAHRQEYEQHLIGLGIKQRSKKE